MTGPKEHDRHVRINFRGFALALGDLSSVISVGVEVAGRSRWLPV
jgi:hypothetical protein